MRTVSLVVFLVIVENFVCGFTNDTIRISTLVPATSYCADTGWEKVPGMKPEYIESSAILHAGVDSQGIVTTCFSKCDNANCTAFVIDFERSVCYTVGTKGQDFVPAPKSTYYHKICLKVPGKCNETRLWQVERTLGAILIDTTSTWLTDILTRKECYEKCIQAGSGCQSAQFRTSRDLSIGDSRGRCALLTISRGTRPQSYRASMYRDEYLENQCHNIPSADYCSYATYRDETLPFSDLKIPALGIDQCEERCNKGNDGFLCRSYTVDNGTSGMPICFLHSDDTIGAGVSSLVKRQNVVYKEREPCLNLHVRCTNTSLTIEFTTLDPFNGRLYTSSPGESCGVQGNDENTTILSIPLPGIGNLTAGNLPCGVSPAFAVDSENRTRTAVWVTVVIQFNPIVQRLGDQSVRVGCTIDDGDVPSPMNVTVQTEFGFADPNAGTPPATWTVFNTTMIPVVTMRILDEHGKDVFLAHMGDKLTLRIDTSPASVPYHIYAGHLVASSSSGASSILLLDEMGCPSNPKIFPPMERDFSNKSLTSTFSAFKFSDSQRVRFDVIVKFCLIDCQPIKCANRSLTYGKKRRSVSIPSSSGDDITKATTPIEATIDELPLEKSIIVQGPTVTADHLRGGQPLNPDTIFIAGEKSLDGLLCVDMALILGLLIFWLCIQIVLTFGCIFLVRRYRKHARRAEEDRADILARHLYGIHGGNFEIARRVRWADRNNGSSIS